MDKFWKESWIEALESGEYDQCEGALENAEGENCCLGVLLDIMDAPYTQEEGAMRSFFHCEQDMLDNIVYNDTVTAYWKGDMKGKFPSGAADVVYGDEGDLPHETRKALGISERQQQKLVQMNDDDDSSFEEIAEWIQDNL